MLASLLNIYKSIWTNVVVFSIHSNQQNKDILQNDNVVLKMLFHQHTFEEDFQLLFQLDISLWHFDQENHQQQNSLRMLYTVEGGRPS